MKVLLFCLLATLSLVCCLHESSSSNDQYIIPEYPSDRPTKPVVLVHSTWSGPTSAARIRHARYIAAQSVDVGTVVARVNRVVKPTVVKKLRNRRLRHPNHENQLVFPTLVPIGHPHFNDSVTNFTRRSGDHGRPFSHQPLVTAVGSVPRAFIADPKVPKILALAPPTLASITATLPPAPVVPVLSANGDNSAVVAAAQAAAAAAAAAQAAAAGELQRRTIEWETRMARLFGPNWRERRANAETRWNNGRPQIRRVQRRSA